MKTTLLQLVQMNEKVILQTYLW